MPGILVEDEHRLPVNTNHHRDRPGHFNRLSMYLDLDSSEDSSDSNKENHFVLVESVSETQNGPRDTGGQPALRPRTLHRVVHTSGGSERRGRSVPVFGSLENLHRNYVNDRRASCQPFFSDNSNQFSSTRPDSAASQLSRYALQSTLAPCSLSIRCNKVYYTFLVKSYYLSIRLYRLFYFYYLIL